MTDSSRLAQPFSTSRIVQTWWPLAASWILMALELPAVSAVVARLGDAETNLAAYGGIVLPLSLIIEAPIIQLLAASTALSKDWDSFLKLRRYMIWGACLLTGLHLLLAFTPLYDFVIVEIIGAPAEIVEPARTGLKIMTPWTAAIAFRRTFQGVLIRFGHSRAVGLGTGVRLSTVAIVLAAGALLGSLSGIIVATVAVVCGVISEAIFSGLRVRPVVREKVRSAPRVDPPLRLPSFVDFYVPLAMTSLLFLLVGPLGSAALSRMPRALDSLAVWPVISGLIFLVRSGGVAYNEVVVALLDEGRALAGLRRFSYLLAGLTTGFLVAFAATPLAEFWFGTVSGLRPGLTTVAVSSLWVALPLPGLTAFQSWYQGILVNWKRTRAITEAVLLFLITAGSLLWLGVVWGRVPGLYVVWTGFSLGALAQVGWLWFRSRPALRQFERVESGQQALHATAD